MTLVGSGVATSSDAVKSQLEDEVIIATSFTAADTGATDWSAFTPARYTWQQWNDSLYGSVVAREEQDLIKAAGTYANHAMFHLNNADSAEYLREHYHDQLAAHFAAFDTQGLDYTERHDFCGTSVSRCRLSDVVAA